MSTQAEDTRPMTAAEVERLMEEEEWYRRRMLAEGLWHKPDPYAGQTTEAVPVVDVWARRNP